MPVIKRRVKLNFTRPLMFDRNFGDNKTQLPPEALMYFAPGTQFLVCPAENILSFLSAENTWSAPKILEGREWRKIAQAMKSYVTVDPLHIPLMDEKGPIAFHGWNAKIYKDQRCARLAKGAGNPKCRPVLMPPVWMEFDLSFVENTEFHESKLVSLFKQGGTQVGLFTFRPAFGQFEVVSWE